MKADRAVVILRSLRVLLGTAVFGAVLVLAAPAAADVLTVTNSNDSGAGSLRDAIANANPNGGTTITFDPSLSGRTITLTTSPLIVTHGLTIAGLGAGSLTIDGDGRSTVFDIEANAQTDNVTISGLTITGGALNGGGITGGGGILANSVDTLTLTGDTITGNETSIGSADDAGGGGVFVNGGALSVTSSTISGNTVTITGTSGSDNGGGGVYSASGVVAITGSDVSNNTLQIASTMDGDNGGGGIYSAGGAILLSADTIDGNTFTLQSDNGGDNGGAGVYSAGGDVDVFASSISGNTGNVTSNFPDNGGGAVWDDGRTSTYYDSTLSANSMTVAGPGAGAGSNNGGGAILTFADATFSDVTIAANSTNQRGGAIANDNAVVLKNTILADNSAASGADCGGTGTFTSDGFNLESADTCGLRNTGDLVNTEPQLGPLQNDGGLTPTQALAAGSPAVDAGSCTDAFGSPVSIDQRGIARPQPAGGNCDIGAYELVPAGATSPPPPSAPAATPGTPTATSSTGAAFSGSVNPQGQATTVFFQYGIDARYRPGGGTAVIYDQSTPAQTLPADSTAHAVSAAAANLVPNALYHVRLVASNATGTTFGADQTFTTPPGPAPPPPTVGKTVNAAPVSGKVFVLVGTKLVPLTEAKQLPSGAVVDALNGSIQLTTAAATGHKRQTGTFGGAIFKLTQARTGSARGLATLSLVEGAFAGAPSYATCKAHHATDATAAAASKRTLQLLHASAHGKFSTRGRYSAATVLGTKWTIADRCDGTLVHDLKDSVVVSDFVRHKRIVLHAGQSYLAKSRLHP
ncbi:MAG TPA: choice-of-anchor Q domain-containing protein [Solirubrobacteraceae bacterium]|nr:choice-of-anchor Q domain-containing protein [Solirubrobacteraceae bacterium]